MRIPEQLWSCLYSHPLKFKAAILDHQELQDMPTDVYNNLAFLFFISDFIKCLSRSIFNFDVSNRNSLSLTFILCFNRQIMKRIICMLNLYPGLSLQRKEVWSYYCGVIFLFNNKFYQKGKDIIKMRLKRNFQHDFDGQMKAFTIIYKRIYLKWTPSQYKVVKNLKENRTPFM